MIEDIQQFHIHICVLENTIKIIFKKNEIKLNQNLPIVHIDDYRKRFQHKIDKAKNVDQ